MNSELVPRGPGHRRLGLLATVVGLRSMLPFAYLAQAVHEGHAPVSAGAARLLGRPAVRYGLTAAAAAEVLADKLAVFPARVRPLPLAGRVLGGGIIGATVARATGRSRAFGALLGAGCAGLGAVLGYTVRRTLAERTVLPDALWGALEDALALGLASRALRR